MNHGRMKGEGSFLGEGTWKTREVVPPSKREKKGGHLHDEVDCRKKKFLGVRGDPAGPLSRKKSG